jgi:hypothetical protein
VRHLVTSYIGRGQLVKAVPHHKTSPPESIVHFASVIAAILIMDTIFPPTPLMDTRLPAKIVIGQAGIIVRRQQ